MRDFFSKMFCEEFMDELAERVAEKLAKRNHYQNIIFKQKVPHHPFKDYEHSMTVYDSCGTLPHTSTQNYDRCGNPINYRSGC